MMTNAAASAIADTAFAAYVEGGTVALTGAGKAVAAIAGGFAAGGISGGNLQSAIIGAFTAGLQFGIGEALGHVTTTLGAANSNYLAKAAAHAAVGCASGAAAGGSCKAGAMAAGFSSLAGPYLPGGNAQGFHGGNMLGRMMVGAVASKLGGGKAENGALTAAFEYLFNELSHSTTCRQRAVCTNDSVSNDRIWRLAGEMKRDVVFFINAVEDELGVRLRVIQGFRTFEEQEALYAQGRTAPGAIVTNARGGASNHNFGYAVDVARLTTNDGIDWTRIDAPIADIASRFNLSWGGTWKFRDYPHFERLPKDRKPGG
jgi:hypothetical protein